MAKHLKNEADDALRCILDTYSEIPSRHARELMAMLGFTARQFERARQRLRCCAFRVANEWLLSNKPRPLYQELERVERPESTQKLLRAAILNALAVRNGVMATNELYDYLRAQGHSTRAVIRARASLELYAYRFERKWWIETAEARAARLRTEERVEIDETYFGGKEATLARLDALVDATVGKRLTYAGLIQ